MKNKLTHFAIHVDDMDRAKKFYSEVFEWGFNSYGSSHFFQITVDGTQNSECIGALQLREHSPVPQKIIGLECSIAVENIDKIMETVAANNGKILLPKTVIPQVGWITKFLDTEGNLICAIQYNPYGR